MSAFQIPIFCGNCARETPHNERCAYYQINADGEDYGVVTRTTHSFLTCNECQEVAYRREVTEDAKHGGARVQSDSEVVSLPMRAQIREMREIGLASESIRRAYKETVDALNNGNNILSAGGMRGIIDLVACDMGWESGCGKSRAAFLVKRGDIGRAHEDTLEDVWKMGCEALHNGQSYPRETLLDALGVVEMLIRNVYHMPKVREGIPQRPPRK